jgi:hypothetical protein
MPFDIFRAGVSVLAAFSHFWSLYLAFSPAVFFLIGASVACAAGATLYGLLRLMRYVGELGRGVEGQKHEAPRGLRMVV